MYYKEARLSNIPFNRMNEPLVMSPSFDILKTQYYEYIKYTNKRDPGLDVLT